MITRTIAYAFSTSLDSAEMAGEILRRLWEASPGKKVLSVTFERTSTVLVRVEVPIDMDDLKKIELCAHFRSAIEKATHTSPPVRILGALGREL
jgi:hypothetical protein